MSVLDLTDKERIAMIRKAAKKFERKQTRQAAVRRTQNNPYDHIVKNENDNIYAWTDESRYANEYYGESYRNTTRYDNDWD